MEKIYGDGSTVELQRLGIAGVDQPRAGESRHALKTMRAPPVFEARPVRDVAVNALLRISYPNANQLVRSLVGQVFQDYRLHHAKESGIHSHAERKRGYGHKGEPRTAGKRAQGVPQIVE